VAASCWCFFCAVEESGAAVGEFCTLIAAVLSSRHCCC
jgi:hypothetical protein